MKHDDHSFESDITLSELSELLGVSKQYLRLLFRKLLNMRPMEYVNKVRINKSKSSYFAIGTKKSLKSPVFRLRGPGGWVCRYADGLKPEGGEIMTDRLMFRIPQCCQDGRAENTDSSLFAFAWFVIKSLSFQAFVRVIEYKKWKMGIWM